MALNIMNLEVDAKHLKEYFEREVWPKMPPEALGKTITREQEEEILGFGHDGV